MNLATRLRDALSDTPSGPLLAADLDPDGDVALRRAAVLVAVTERADPGVLLTIRHEQLRTHAGQVAFPGGRIDPGEDAAAAALREAWEELGLDPAKAQVLGNLDTYRTITGFQVTPVLAVVEADQRFTPHDAEVADWFEAPLSFLLDPSNHRRQSVVFAGRRRHYYEIMWNDRRIWGATAAMIVNLSKRLSWS